MLLVRLIPAILLGLGVGLPALGNGATTQLQGNMILGHGCASDPNCAADAIELGKFSLKSSSKAEDGGGTLKLKLSGIRKNGSELDNASVTLSLGLDRSETASCDAHTYRSPDLKIEDGKLKGSAKIPFAAFLPPISRQEDTPLRLHNVRLSVTVQRTPGDLLTLDEIAVDGLRQGPAEGAKTKAKGNLLLSEECEGDPSCVIDVLEKGKFLFKSSKKAGTNGVEIKLSLKGLTHSGVKVNLEEAGASIDLAVDGGSCETYSAPNFSVEKGVAKGAIKKFTGADLSPPLATSPGSSLRLCGDGIQVYDDGSQLIAADGLLHGGCEEQDCPGIQPVQAGFLTDPNQMMGWIETIVAQGIRRPGYPADDWAEQWARDRFIEFGLQDVTLDPIDVQRWEPLQWSLTVWHDSDPNDRLAIPCYPVPFSGHTESLQGSLALAEGGGDLSGKIAVTETGFFGLPQSIARLFAAWTYDPSREFDTHVQTLPFSVEFQGVMDAAISAGAAAFVGILDVPWETDRYYVPYDAQERPIPGLWLSKSNGETLKAFLDAGPASGEIVLERDLQTVTSHNVTGTLPGASDEWIIIGSHHDGPWASAVEDGSGIALVIAQASYWSQVPEQERPHNLLFLLNGGHMSGGAGLIHFVSTNTQWLQEEVLVEIHLEHAAREVRGESGVLVATGDPEVRWWFTSLVPPLQEAVAQAICVEGLQRSLIMPPEGFPPGSAHPPTDGAFFHPHTAIVNFLTAPMYLFDQQDTLDKVDEESLVPLTRAAIRIVNGLQGYSAAELRPEP
jgi:hypothetical protein